jgi:glutamate dehydrogenase/leucine dehydrogenase
MRDRSQGVLDAMKAGGHELVVYGSDERCRLRSIIAIHSTVLGPALGGTRFFPYPDEDAALTEVLRLSAGMTLKSAAAGLDLGGGKAVIIGDPDVDRSDDLLEAYGRVVDSLAGRYVTAEDVGTTVEDMTVVARRTTHVKGLPMREGGSGDPSPMTARGVVASMRAVAVNLWGDPSLAGRVVAIQGVGKVGGALADLLVGADVELIVADIDDESVDAVAARTGAKSVAPEDLLSVPCDILAPCALGGVLSELTVPDLQCTAVVGSANNQLAARDDADRLAAVGVLYAPDFVANAGGIVNISVELEPGGYSKARAERHVDRIFDRMQEILVSARRNTITPLAAAERLAYERIEARTQRSVVP